MLLCGSYYIDGNDMFDFVWEGFFKTESFIAYDPPDAALVPGRPPQSDLAFDAIALIGKFRNVTSIRDWGIPLLLSDLRIRHVKETVDRVWAVVGLFDEDLQGQLSSFVNYSDQGRAEYWKTFVCFAKAINKKNRSLKLLSIPRSVEQRVRCMPSWCPEISGFPACKMYLNGSWNRPTSIRYAVVQPLLRADQDEQTGEMEVFAHQDHPLKFISILETEDLLQTRGLIVDMVSEVVEDPRLFGSTKAFLGLIYPQIFQHALYATFVEFYNQALGLARHVHHGSKEPSSDIPLEFLMCLLVDERVLEGAKLAFDDAMTGLTTKSKEHFLVRHPLAGHCFYQCMHMLGHSFFSTEGGRSGVAHPGLKTGDKV